jgi:hypothetical protein
MREIVKLFKTIDILTFSHLHKCITSAGIESYINLFLDVDSIPSSAKVFDPVKYRGDNALIGFGSNHSS